MALQHFFVLFCMDANIWGSSVNDIIGGLTQYSLNSC